MTTPTNDLQQFFGIEKIPERDDAAELLTLLSEKIGDLLLHNPDKLVYIFYKMDIDENKMMHILKENMTKAPQLLAQLVFERQLQKIAYKKMFPQTPPNNADEAW